MTQPVARGVGRPPRVSADAILDAAALMPAEELTLTALAATLGISVKTVYYYFANRGALLASLSARSLSQLAPPDFSTRDDWQVVLQKMGRWTFDVLRDQPFGALQDAGSVMTGLTHVLMPCLETLRQAGFTDEDALEALVLISNFAIGAAASAQNTARAGGLSPTNLREWMHKIDGSGSGTAVTTILSSRTVDGWFESALELAIAGAAAAHRRRQRRR